MKIMTSILRGQFLLLLLISTKTDRTIIHGETIMIYILLYHEKAGNSQVLNGHNEFPILIYNNVIINYTFHGEQYFLKKLILI